MERIMDNQGTETTALGPAGDSLMTPCYRCDSVFDHVADTYCPNCSGCGECGCCPCGKDSCEDCRLEAEAIAENNDRHENRYERLAEPFVAAYGRLAHAREERTKAKKP